MNDDEAKTYPPPRGIRSYETNVAMPQGGSAPRTKPQQLEDELENLTHSLASIVLTPEAILRRLIANPPAVLQNTPSFPSEQKQTTPSDTGATLSPFTNKRNQPKYKTYVKNPEVVTAVEWDGEVNTISQLAPYTNMIRPPNITVEKTLELVSHGYQREEAWPGDYLVRQEDGTLNVMRPAEFHDTYTLLNQPPPHPSYFTHFGE